jgi:hypothetical protein
MNLIALKDIVSTDGTRPVVKKGSLFYLNIPIGSSRGVIKGAEPIILGVNARYLTPQEIADYKKNERYEGLSPSQLRQMLEERESLLAERDTQRETQIPNTQSSKSPINKSNLILWVLGGAIVGYLIFVKK